MKKIINRNINIIFTSLIILCLVITNFLSYKDKVKAQEEFIMSSLGFLSYREISSNELKKFKENFNDLEILLKNEDGQIIYDSGINKIKIKNYEFENNNMVKKSKKNYFSYNTNLYAMKINNKILAIGFKSQSFINYLIRRTHIYLLAIVFILFINKILSKSIYRDLLFQFKDLFKNSETFDEFSNNPKEFLLKEKNKIENLEAQNESLLSKIMNIEKITSNMEEGFIYFDKNGKIIIINDQAKNLLGVGDDVKIDNLIDNDDYKLTLRQTKLLKKGKDIDLDLDEISVKLFIDPIVYEDIDSYIILIIDDSKNKKAEVMRREFTANVTHELKSPLTSINGYAELIATGLAKNDDVKKFGKIINEEGNRLLNIIDDILKLSKLDEENLEEGRTIINVKDIADKVVIKFKRISDKKNIEVINEINDIFIRTHESLFTDLITNIYENAIKYNKVNGKIFLKYQVYKRNTNLIIEDTGIGIKREDTKRIFERFYVADKQRTRTLKSTGLGLSIVKHICDYLNYNIKVESKYGYGTRFVISIPNN
ncbi:two-component sensor histidine kinase [Anaerococcus sp. AGMB00486]|uniref:histidine kinase n=1 Tax=Anaerococcus faecalis TaxID=2742993 RepID=A0ABX2N868_9FIRM|nr:ATP-binding protein [Anaerococcus faecalis]NVF10891.1 two-component sensor histidine kinase [Anaerococcus faecalis]